MFRSVPAANPVADGCALSTVLIIRHAVIGGHIEKRDPDVPVCHSCPDGYALRGCCLVSGRPSRSFAEMHLICGSQVSVITVPDCDLGWARRQRCLRQMPVNWRWRKWPLAFEFELPAPIMQDGGAADHHRQRFGLVMFAATAMARLPLTHSPFA